MTDLEAIRARHSVRAYLEKPIPRSCAGSWTPVSKPATGRADCISA